MSYIANHARSLEDALTMVASGVPNIISRIPLWDLMNHATLVRVGLFDFDGTLTPGSQWRAMGALLPEDLRAIDQENYDWYFRHLHNQDANGLDLDDPDWWIGHLETGNKLAVDGAWLAATVFMQQQAGVTRNQLRQAATTLPARRGITPLLKMMRHKAVISFGIEQFIQDWLAHNGLTAHVAASRLIFDTESRVQRTHINIVSAGSKAFAAARFRRLVDVPEREILVTGDCVVDIHMMGSETFNVLIVPPSELDKKLSDFRYNNLAEMWSRISMILADDSLEPLVAFLRKARESA